MPILFLLAEIADKMTPKEDLWIIPFQIGCCLSVITIGLSLMKLRAGWVGVGVALLFGIFLVGDTSMDLDIRRELGNSYLVWRKLVSFIPLVMTAMIFLIVWFIFKQFKSTS